MVKVRPFLNDSENPIANQYQIETPDGLYFQSYQTIVAFIPVEGPVQLDKHTCNNFTQTTAKYLYRFLGAQRILIEKRIADGTYILTNLNKRGKING